MERIGIIGVGEIARAMVDGLCDGAEEPPEIFLSPRGARAAAELSQRYPNVQVCTDNQDVVDRSEILIIAVRPQDRSEALAGLRIGDAVVVISVMAGVTVSELRGTVGAAPVVRAIPLPPVRERRCVTVTHPSHPVADALFDRLGGALPVADEAAFSIFAALTATMSTHYWFMAALTTWASRQGVPTEEADRYIRSLFQGAAQALDDGTRSLHELAGDHETPKGLNERVRTGWFDTPNSEALTGTLDALLADIT